MDSLPINITDIGILLVMLISGALAFLRGFVREVLAIGAWAGAIVATFFAFPYAQSYPRLYIAEPLIADIVTAVAIFLVVVVILSIIASMVSKRVRDSEIGALDRSLGFLFGLVRGAFLLVLAYMALALMVAPKDRPSWLQEARALPLLHYSSTVLVDLTPLAWKEFLAPASEETPSDQKTPPGNPTGSRKSSDTRQETGYTGSARQDMDRLIRSQQGN